MSDTKPKRTLSEEQKAKMQAAAKAAREKRDAEEKKNPELKAERLAKAKAKRDGKKPDDKSNDEEKTSMTQIYCLNYAQDNGDSVYRNTTMYASIGGLVAGIENLIRGVKKDNLSDYDIIDDDEIVDTPSYAKNLFYYTGHESMKDVPIPTQSDVEKFLNNNKQSGLMMKIGPEMGSADGFGCEISIHVKPLNP